MPFARRDRGDRKRRHRVGPPQAGEGVCAQAGEERQRHVGADHVLAALGDGRPGAERAPDPALRPGQKRHRRRRDRGQADPDPARARVLAGEEVAPGGDAM